MENSHIISKLSTNKTVFQALLKEISEQQAVWKPTSSQWSMLHVICHLVDEEKFDFRQRTKLLLENPEQELPKFNPLNWVIDHNYHEQDLDGKLIEFVDERTQSIDWLKSLKNPNWQNQQIHPALGVVTPEFFLANWLAHDYIHIRQLNRLAYGYLEISTGADLTYAGNW